MSKTILITGATDGIGLETAKKLVKQGHHVLVHGRSQSKLENVKSELDKNGSSEVYIADLSELVQVKMLAKKVLKQHLTIDVLINNAGVFKLANPIARNGLDQRFLVNTIAPYLLTRELLDFFSDQGRVINISSAAQSPVDIQALAGEVALDDSDAYAQSKLAITMWSFYMAKKYCSPSFIAVNPASFLGSKMVKEAYGSQGKDLSIGADILVAASTSDEFSNVSGKYYDNDIQEFANPNREALDDSKNAELVRQVDMLIQRFG